MRLRVQLVATIWFQPETHALPANDVRQKNETEV